MLVEALREDRPLSGTCWPRALIGFGSASLSPARTRSHTFPQVLPSRPTWCRCTTTASALADLGRNLSSCMMRGVNLPTHSVKLDAPCSLRESVTERDEAVVAYATPSDIADHFDLDGV